MAAKGNVLLKAFIDIFAKEARGKVLDFGAAAGNYSVELDRLGFEVVAADVTKNFRFRDRIKFVELQEKGPLPFAENTFDYVVLAEVIEHLKDPYGLIGEFHRILRRGGKLVLSTPNILNLRSRCRFFTEGSYDYFREPPLDHKAHNARTGIDISQVHVIPWRYPDLEFLLTESGFEIRDIKASVYEGKGLSFLAPLIKFQSRSKEKRSLRKGGIDYGRINKILLSRELLFGRHLIVSAAKV